MARALPGKARQRGDYAPKRMLLAADIGNTQTVYGLFEGDRLVDHFRIATETRRLADEISVLIDGLVELDSVDGFCLSSTVPALQREYERFAERAGLPLLVVGPGVSTGIAIRYDDPREVGPDRIANAVAAKERYGAPCIVVDFGTSTNFDVVSPEGEYVGGVLAPGIEISMDALFARAARLFRVDFAPPPTVIGKTTQTALQSGLVYGFAGQVDEIVTRIRKELGVEARAVATGGLAELVAPHSRTLERVDPFLTLEGLRIVYDRNRT
jgi:type III pantothenate kinase